MLTANSKSNGGVALPVLSPHVRLRTKNTPPLTVGYTSGNMLYVGGAFSVAQIGNCVLAISALRIARTEANFALFKVSK
jgi:hypothetical protein